MLVAAKECHLKFRGKSKPRIGIYAGAFDPVHNGHIAFAKEAIQKAHLERVYFLVEPRPRHKQGVKSLAHRMAMVELAIADEPALGHIILDQDRFTVYETWPILQSRFEGAQLFMLMGEDVFRRVAHWPRIDELVTSAQFIVGLRNGHNEDDLRQHFTVLESTKSLKLQYDIFRTEHAKVSSTEVRRSLRAGKIPSTIHPEVAAYIAANQLYSSEFVA